jgi:hypothetical protein
VGNVFLLPTKPVVRLEMVGKRAERKGLNLSVVPPAYPPYLAFLSESGFSKLSTTNWKSKQRIKPEACSSDSLFVFQIRCTILSESGFTGFTRFPG